MAEHTVHKFEDADALCDCLAKVIAETLQAAVKRDGSASLVVSGGRTPQPLFARLCKARIDWHAVTVTLADERWVSPESDDSNEAFVRRHLLVGAAAFARFVPLKTPHATPEDGEDSCAAALCTMTSPRDVVVLGMGDDGHTASFFPGARTLRVALDMGSGRPCCAVRPTTAPHPRMTATLPWLLDTRLLVLHFTGATKWTVYERAHKDGPKEELPVRAVLQQERIPVEIYWAP